MTDDNQEINVEICKILGISYSKIIYESFARLPGFNKILRIDYTGPDFCNDLNAMHDVWKWMCQNGDSSDSDNLYWESIRTTYGEQLENYAQCRVTINGGCLSYVLPNLTAKQKAVCFLNAFNKTRE